MGPELAEEAARERNRLFRSVFGLVLGRRCGLSLDGGGISRSLSGTGLGLCVGR